MLERLRAIDEHSWHNEGDTSEHEIRTFMIVPLLQALGWEPRRIKVEWRHTDIALFDKQYRTDAGLQPTAILESKVHGNGLLEAPRQAQHYAEQYPKCRRVIVSDGARYVIYDRNGNAWKKSGYVYLYAPLANNPLEPDLGNAVDALAKLLPL